MPVGSFSGDLDRKVTRCGAHSLDSRRGGCWGKIFLTASFEIFQAMRKKRVPTLSGVVCAIESRDLVGPDSDGWRRPSSESSCVGRPVGLRGAGDSVCQRPHHREKTGSRQLPAVKRGRVWLVPRLVTAWESQMRLARAFCERPPGRERKAA